MAVILGAVINYGIYIPRNIDNLRLLAISSVELITADNAVGDIAGSRNSHCCNKAVGIGTRVDYRIDISGGVNNIWIYAITGIEFQCIDNAVAYISVCRDSYGYQEAVATCTPICNSEVSAGYVYNIWCIAVAGVEFQRIDNAVADIAVGGDGDGDKKSIVLGSTVGDGIVDAGYENDIWFITVARGDFQPVS